jgi:pyruvate,water dikinase
MGNGKFIFWIDELCQHDNDLVGKKCANLGELAKTGFRVPPGFALSVTAYDEFLKQTGALEEIRRHFSTFDADPNNPKDIGKFTESSSIVREIVESKAMPTMMEEAIGGYYAELCKKTGIENVFVATRSAGSVSHPGQYETYLFVSGKSDVLGNIRRVWSSTFNARSLVARARKCLPLHYDPIGVAVLKMINAKAAGIMFTAEPTTADWSKVVIEGNWGVGESVVSGAVSPDRWIVDKRTEEIIESHISQKLIYHRLDETTGKLASLNLSTDQQREPCLTRGEVVALVRVGERAERHFGRPQDIEWAVDSLQPEDIFVLQTRHEKFFVELRLAGF